MLGQLAQGPEAYDSFIAFAKQPVIMIGELLVIVAGIYHGFNGIRIALNSFGVAVPIQRQLLFGVVGISLVSAVVFGLRMIATH